MNAANCERTASSQLVHVLRKCKWVPQGDGLFVCPMDADRSKLPKGFRLAEGDTWIKAIKFGQGEHLRALESRKQDAANQAHAKALGLPDAETAMRFAAIPAAEQQKMLTIYERTQQDHLPRRESNDPQRRAEKVAREAADAPRRTTEQRMRSVSVGRDEIKEETKPYLREQYTNEDGEMICQICKDRLPFTLDDGNDYFEAVEFLPELNRHHKQNYLALCPNHAAMFQYANGSTKQLKEMFEEMAGTEMTITLAQADAVVYFTQKHVDDLKTIIKTERQRASDPQ